MSETTHKSKKLEQIRNFCIIAHIDHGKSTLADRFLQHTKVVDPRDFRDQMLDNMDIERERGITIKSQSVSLPYCAKDGQIYILNLVDTPGHVDFSYEVSRALVSCEGALLLVDASQGVEAQTVANLYLALEHNLEVIPVINKIDLPSADIEHTREQIDKELGLDGDSAILASGKLGIGVEDLLEAVVHRIPCPQGSAENPLSALIYDCHYDTYRGVVISCRVFNGQVKAGEMIRLMSNNAVYRVEEVGIFRLKLVPQPSLSTGDVGYIIAGVKNIADTRSGDTITIHDRPCAAPLAGFKEVKPVVFSSFYPIASDGYEEFAEAFARLKLNDAALIYEKDSSSALGSGFRCGFLGLLHLEIVQERLEREYDQSMIITAPSVRYKFILHNHETVFVDNPVNYPDPSHIDAVEEPYIRGMIMVPAEFLGNIINLCIERRGEQHALNYLDKKRVELTFDLPLAEVIFDFYDKLKSYSRGYASFDYEFLEYRRSDVAKVDILVNGELVDAFSQLVHRSRAEARARVTCKKLKESIPRQLFKIPLQGAIGGKIIARETISPLRKDVTAKCYGGDVTRKRKLLDRQKEGKKRMKELGRVFIPQEAFLAVLKTRDEE